jgi:hypothetical protein
MNSQKPTIAVLATLFASLALADDIKTVSGKEYKNATVSRVEPDGLMVKFSGGFVKVPFSELSKELQDKYHYNPEQAAVARTAEAAAIEQANQQTEELAKQKAEEQSKQRNKQGNIQALRNSLAALQEEEDSLLVQIGRVQTAAKAAARHWSSQGGATSQSQGGATSQQSSMSGQWGTDPSEAQLPRLWSRLDDVRREKQRVRQQPDRLAEEERTQYQP